MNAYHKTRSMFQSQPAAAAMRTPGRRASGLMDFVDTLVTQVLQDVLILYPGPQAPQPHYCNQLHP